MYLSLEDCINKINEAISITIIGRDDPSINAAMDFFNALKENKEIKFEVSERSNILNRDIYKIIENNKDLVLFLGIYPQSYSIFKNSNMKNIIKFTDSIDVGNEKSYLVNRNNLPAIPEEFSPTTSFANTAYKIIKELIPSYEPTDEIAKKAFIGDYDDNLKLEPTKFQKEIAKYIKNYDEKNEIPNFDSVSILNFYPFFFLKFIEKEDFRKNIKSIEGRKNIVNEILRYCNLDENILIKELEKRGLPHDIIYSPRIDGSNKIEVLRKIGYNKKINNNTSKEIIKTHISEFISGKINSKIIKGNHPVSSDEKEIDLICLQTEKNINLMGFTEILTFLPNDSIFIVYRNNNNNIYTSYAIFSKSDIHAGLLCSLGSVKKNKNLRGRGSGEIDKALGYRNLIEDSPVTYEWVLKNFLKKSCSSTSYADKSTYKAFYGQPSALEINQKDGSIKYSLFYLPWEGNVIFDCNKDEYENFCKKYGSKAEIFKVFYD
ncbi:MAG: hypothetical protein QW469_02830 [Candidatus Aenigmatarchaeota archaeon]